jgi:predicted NBD/HSP70 family sugar kinase
MPLSPKALAIHVGVNHTRFSRIDPSDPAPIDLAHEWEQVLPTPNSPGKFAELVRSTISTFGPGFGKVGVSLPGVVDEAAGMGLVSPNLPWVEQFRIADLCARETNSPVVVVQEVRALALGHLATTGDRDFLLVDFGSGMGSAIVLDGQLLKNAIPVSGEIGHIHVPDCDRRCGCGAVGCVETLMSRKALLKDLSALTGASAGDFDVLAQHVARHGIEPWLAERLSAAGRAIASALNTVGLAKVVVTGSLEQLPSVVIAAVADATRKHALAARYRTIDITAAHRQRLAGLRAAIAA